MSDETTGVPSHFRLAGHSARERWGEPDPSLLDQIDDLIDVSAGRATATFAGLTLESSFQPVVSLAHGRAVGYETLLRARDAAHTPVAPLEVFADATREGTATFLDTLCRALHLRNFRLQGVHEGWLFLNLNPRALVDGAKLSPLLCTMMEREKLSPHRVVVEIVESKTFDEGQLAETVTYFRELGCLIAIDDFGAGQSNFERVWRMAPDVVKLDRSMLTEALRTPRVRRILPGLTSLIHEAGCLVVLEGIETEEQALIALEMDVDFVQGYFFARPEPTIGIEPTAYRAQLEDLFDSYRRETSSQVSEARDLLLRFTTALERCAQDMRSGVDADAACREFLELPGVERCYVLSEDGSQLASTASSRGWQSVADPRFAPLVDTEGANWFRRPYFRRAVTRPMNVQVSHPYLSARDARSCMTLSIAVPTPAGLRVLCADLDWESDDSVLRTPSWRPPMLTLTDLK